LGGAPVVLERWGEGGFGAAGPAGLGWSATARLAVCLPVAPAGPALQEAASEERIRGAKKLEAAEGSKSGGRRRAPAGPRRGAARRAATTFRPVGRQAGRQRAERAIARYRGRGKRLEETWGGREERRRKGRKETRLEWRGGSRFCGNRTATAPVSAASVGGSQYRGRVLDLVPLPPSLSTPHVDVDVVQL